MIIEAVLVPIKSSCKHF